jgi:hypothetical protein
LLSALRAAGALVEVDLIAGERHRARLVVAGKWHVSALRSEADGLADEDDVDAAGEFLVDLEGLPDGAVLPVGGLRAGVLELQGVLMDPLS